MSKPQGGREASQADILVKSVLSRGNSRYTISVCKYAPHACMFASGPAETSVAGGVRESERSGRGRRQNGDRLGLGLARNGETEHT